MYWTFFVHRVWISVGTYIHIVCMFSKCILGHEYFIYSIDMCLDVSI
jgi:hypothetical protein